MENKSRKILRYVVPSLLVLGALFTQLNIRNIVGGRVFLLFYPAVFFGAFFGGLVPGVIAALLATLLVWYFFLPVTTPSDLIGLLIFNLMGISFSIFGEVLRRSQFKEREARELSEATSEKLRTSNAALEAREIERTQLLERLENLDKLKTQFFANVSHELRTPLTLILGPVETFLSSNPSEEVRTLLEQVQRNARTLLRHVNDLLDVARLEAGKFVINYVEMDIAKVVKQTAANFEPMAKERQLQYIIESPASMIAQIDYDKIQRVLMNLLSNAFKFVLDGGKVRCTLRIEQSKETKADQVIIEVADSGPGVADKHREAIFDRFFQVEDSSVRRFGGTGLGLAIVKDFIELHNGNVKVTTAPEGGALFTVQFPLLAPKGVYVGSAPLLEVADEPLSKTTAQTEMSTEKKPEPAINESDLESGLKRPLILVVEDNREMSRYICDVLAQDYRTITAMNGQEGLEKAIKLNPALIISDLMMPVMSGDQMVKTLRSRLGLKSLPIILLTAKADDELRSKMLRDGAQDYLIKPFSPDELRARSRNLILARDLQENLRHSHETETRLRHEIERIMGASTAVSEAVASLPETGLQIALKAIALQAQSLVDAEYAALGIAASPNHPFEPWVVVGISDEEAAKIGLPPRPIGTLGIPAREGMIVRVKDIHHHPKFIGLPANHPNITSLLGVPIFYRGRTVGNIFLANKRGADEFSADDERRVQMLSARTGVAIETARLYENENLQKTWLQSIFDQMPEGVLIVDETGKILQQNLVARSLSRESGKKDIWGNPLPHDIRTSAGVPVPLEQLPIHKALTRGETSTGAEFTIFGPDNELIPVLVSATPVKTRKGKMGAVAIFQDIRTLKELERLRDEWSSIIAHDLRQPVATIRLRADLIEKLRTDKIPENEKKALDGIREDVARIDRMISDLLDLSRIEAKRMSIERKTLNLPELTMKVVENLRGLLTDNSIKVSSENPKLFALIDADRFQQVIGNLLSNAAKYGNPKSEIQVEIKQRNDQIEVVVTNHGPGIPPDQLPILFSRFARTREAKAGRAGGLGLGLYIIKGLIEAHGGKIWAESTLGETTSFHFTLPISKEPSPPAPKKEVHHEKKSNLKKLPLRDVKVLIVDDAADMLQLLRTFLEDAGANVSEAQSVTEAMTEVSHSRPDVMITDIEMPDENGYDLIKRLHQLTNQKKIHIPIAALTAHTDEKELKKILDAGFDARLSKPLSADKLVSSVREIMDRI